MNPLAEQFDNRLTGLPVLGVCGLSGAGKTTLIESILVDLAARGLKTVVVKHGCRELEVDRKGKDSDRLFAAGADVYLCGGERFSRLHGPADDLVLELINLADRYDLVLVEGHAGSPVEKIWLLSDGEDGEPAAAGISLVLGRSENRRAKCLSFIDDFLQEKQLRTPLWACILIGGRSSRMGQPKHLLAANQDTSWLERTVETVSPLVEGVALSGAGEVMESLESLPRIGDIPGLKGPMTGLLSAMRFQPRTSWLLIGCDMPSISSEAINWLLQNRLPGIWATMPRLSAKAPVEPLLACYDFRCRYLVEELAVNDIRRIRKIAKSSKVIKPVIPKEFVSAWHNINTPGELTEFTGSS